MTGTRTTIGFDEAALAALPPTAPFVQVMREEAFAAHLALPLPSDETEEWRYTDLSELELTFAPRPDFGCFAFRSPVAARRFIETGGSSSTKASRWSQSSLPAGSAASPKIRSPT